MINFHILYIDLKTKISHGYNVKAPTIKDALIQAKKNNITNIIYIVNQDLVNDF